MQGKQGIVKHIYRGIVFLYDGNEEENGGYLTCKSNMCEKVKVAVGDCSGKVWNLSSILLCYKLSDYFSRVFDVLNAVLYSGQ